MFDFLFGKKKNKEPAAIAESLAKQEKYVWIVTPGYVDENEASPPRYNRKMLVEDEECKKIDGDKVRFWYNYIDCNGVKAGVMSTVEPQYAFEKEEDAIEVHRVEMLKYADALTELAYQISLEYMTKRQLTNEQLREKAKTNKPPQWWYDGEDDIVDNEKMIQYSEENPIPQEWYEEEPQTEPETP